MYNILITSLVVNVKDKEHIGAAFIANFAISAEDLLSEKTIDGNSSILYSNPLNIFLFNILISRIKNVYFILSRLVYLDGQ